MPSAFPLRYFDSTTIHHKDTFSLLRSTFSDSAWNATPTSYPFRNLTPRIYSFSFLSRFAFSGMSSIKSIPKCGLGLHLRLPKALLLYIKTRESYPISWLALFYYFKNVNAQVPSSLDLRLTDSAWNATPAWLCVVALRSKIYTLSRVSTFLFKSLGSWCTLDCVFPLLSCLLIHSACTLEL